MLGPLENQDRLRDMKPYSSFDGGYPPTVLMLGKTHGKSPSVPPPLLGSPRTHHWRSVARNSPTMSPLIPVPTTQFLPHSTVMHCCNPDKTLWHQDEIEFKCVQSMAGTRLPINAIPPLKRGEGSSLVWAPKHPTDQTSGSSAQRN